MIDLSAPDAPDLTMGLTRFEFRPRADAPAAWTVVDRTGVAPSFPGPAGTVFASGGPGAAPIGPGLRFDDFEILGELGEGSLARVYLARQVSLGRIVALKVSAARTGEARALAGLEHDHIVRVFSEAVDPESGHYLLCMQYVPGMSLERLLRELRRRGARSWTGRTILDVIDEAGPHPVAIDPAALRDRDLLERADRVEAACWIGARLAEALACAHAQGVLHRDVKPANVLVNPYGRPLLADFNLASDLRREEGGLFGGSLAFMAPEHLEAFNAEEPTTAAAVDERSDLFALGVVLFELLTGTSPFPPVAGPARAAETLRAMAADRRRGAPSARAIDPEIPPALDQVLRRCLDPDPSRRQATAAALAADLEGCRALRRIEAELPGGPLIRLALQRPATALALAAFLPQLLGSAINISYNALRIVGDLTTDGQVRFGQLALAYNAVVYPLGLAVAYRLTAPVFRALRAIDRGEPIATGAADARRRALSWPLRAVALAGVGWLPGGFLFPLALAAGPGPATPIGPEVFGHFLASFGISGLIALTYSYFGVECVALRIVYPRLWIDARGLRAATAAELGCREGRTAAFPLLASLIPLAGAALLIGLGPGDLSRTFRALVVALIALGMAGIGLTQSAARLLSRTLAVLVGTDGRPPARPGRADGDAAWAREIRPARHTRGRGCMRGSSEARNRPTAGRRVEAESESLA